jgi:L-lysine 2,3-aminomutase
MSRKDRDEDLPHRDQRPIERQAEKSRKELEKVPEPGTDPLHEGP